MHNVIKSFFDHACSIAINDNNALKEYLSSNKAHIFIGNVLFPIDKKYRELEKKCLSSIRKKYSVHSISDIELTNLLTKLSARQFHDKGNQAQNFINELESISQSKIIHFEPNFAIELADDINQFDIGPVKIIRSNQIQSSYSDYFSHTDIITDNNNYGLEFPNSEESNSTFTLPQFSFIFSLQCSPKRAKHLSELYGEIALSLLRMYIFRTKTNYGLFPYIGDLDPLLFSQRLRKEQGVTINLSQKDNRSIGHMNYPVYTVSQETQRRFFDETNFKQVCLKIYEGKSNLLQRIQRALSWMTKARLSTDTADRFLFFFTALEAILSNNDKTAPITDTIARNASTIIAKVDFRYEYYKDIKNLYGVRSSIVHSGSKEVLKSDCDKLQLITEMVCFSMIDKCLDMDLPAFHEGLKKASFGTEWLSE